MRLTGRYKHGHFTLVILEEQGGREKAKQAHAVRLRYWLTYACRWIEGPWPFRQCLAHPSQDIFQAKDHVSDRKVLLWKGQGFQVPGGLQQITHLLYEDLGGWGQKASSPCIWEAIWRYDPVIDNRLRRLGDTGGTGCYSLGDFCPCNPATQRSSFSLVSRMM